MWGAFREGLGVGEERVGIGGGVEKGKRKEGWAPGREVSKEIREEISRGEVGFGEGEE